MVDLDLLIINVGGTRKRVYQDLSNDYSAVDTPFWAALTAGYLRNLQFSTDLLDANAENLDFDETTDRVVALMPRYTAIVCYSQQANVCAPIMVGVTELCQKIKHRLPEQQIIISGWHPSALPERTLLELECDIVIQGEGFHALRDLLAGSEKDRIPGLWWQEDGEVKHNDRTGNIEDLSTELADVAWDLLPMKGRRYRAFNWMCLADLESRNRFASMFTSLGCPFRCSFCAIHATYGEHKLRCWSTDWVMKQLDILVNAYQIKNINLHDELFIYQENHFLPIAKGIIERGYDLNIATFARVDILDGLPIEDLKLLKKAGINWFKLGIETGNRGILRQVKKGGFTKDTIRRVVKKVHNAGIDLCANFMFGLPGDTLDTIQENLDFAMALQCAFPSFFCTMAIPGSQLYETALAKSLPLPTTWLGYASQGYDFMPLPNENLTSAEIIRFRDHAFDAYFSNPDYLNMIERKFGEAARQHIQGMTGIKLKRKLLGD